MNTRIGVLTAMITTLLIAPSPAGAGGKKPSKEEDVLFKKAGAFVKAFNAGDAKALAAFWAEDCDYVSQTGRHVKGRKAIEELYRNFFAQRKGAKLRITVDSVRFLKPNVAVEDGLTELIPPDGGPVTATSYTILHIKDGEEWRLSSLREAAPPSPSQYGHLRGLEWLLGEWADASHGEAARATFAWAENQNFIVATIVTTRKDVPVGGSTQWIGYDAVDRMIRSWSFDSRGGIAEGVWSQKGKEWRVASTARLSDGKTVKGTTILTPVDGETLSWRSVNRSVDGQKMPDSEEVRLKRVKGAAP
jgi:uncharacterized protein (TIGR02246 family)